MLLVDTDVPRLSAAEGLLIADALSGTACLPHDASLLWSDVQDAIELDRLDEEWDVDGPALVAKLRAASELESRVLLERLHAATLLSERHATTPSLEESLRLVGLVR